jgi:hypothetical protein
MYWARFSLELPHLLSKINHKKHRQENLLEHFFLHRCLHLLATTANKTTARWEKESTTRDTWVLYKKNWPNIILTRKKREKPPLKIIGSASQGATKRVVSQKHLQLRRPQSSLLLRPVSALSIFSRGQASRSRGDNEARDESGIPYNNQPFHSHVDRAVVLFG